MSGTDPNGKWFGKKADNTEAFQPDGAGSGQHPPLPADLPKIPGITLHYEIARGGMGVVYSGRQDFLDRRVAVKFLSMDLGGEAFAQRFQREAKILAGISHPNIVGCHMADTTPEGQSYLVMEFCDGPSLKAWIADNGPVESIAALRMIRSSALALAHAHQSDIIHRDIKPENILLESVTSTALDIRFPFTPKIVDLGLARMTHEQVGAGLTSPGSVMGTPSTMSPEQFDDPDSVDFRSDIYGLGCCLYEMLVGHPAFRGSKLTDIVLRKRDANAPNPCDENPAIPAAVGAFTQRLLASDRADRPASYKDMDKELGDLMTTLLQSRSQGGAATAAGASDILDQTVPSAPGGMPPKQPSNVDATMPSPPRPPAGSGTQSGGNTAPGMLNTGELDFLSEGVPPAGTSPGPSFQEGTNATNPMGGSTGVGTNTGVGDGDGGKKGLYIGVGAAVLIAAVVGIVLGLGGKEQPEDPDNKTTKNTASTDGGNNNPGAANAAPTVGSPVLLVGGESVDGAAIELQSVFELKVEASDQDGDELHYKWSWPAGTMSPMSQTDAANIRFKLQDGLPGVEHLIRVEVTDERVADPIEREIRVKVGECPARMPLIGFDATGVWESTGTWREVSDIANPENRGVAGRVRGGQPAFLTTRLDTDSYWQWSGSLAPSEMGDGVATALVAINFGDRGYALSCGLAKEETEWTVNVLEQVPGQDAWRPMAPPTNATWVHPADSNATSRGAFAVRRIGKKLELLVGEYAQPAPQEGKPLPSPTLSWQPAVEIDLTDDDCSALAAGGSLKLIVTKGRCVFRAERQ